MHKQDNKIKTVTRQITPAQNELLAFCRHVEAPDILESFNKVLESAVFNIINDDKEAMYKTYLLCEVLKGLKDEGVPQIGQVA